MFSKRVNGTSKSRLLFLFAMIYLAGCGNWEGPPTTETSSSKFNTLSEKVAFLEQYVKFRRTYQELDFVITYRNNSYGLVPGPSDWDIRIVARVRSADLAQWTEGLEATASPDVDWLEALPGRIDHTGVSAWFQSGKRLVGVDKRNAIIVYRNSSM